MRVITTLSIFRSSGRIGGTPEKRMRFPIEVVSVVRKYWPEHKPLFLRMSAVDEAGWSTDDSSAVACVLKTQGVDVSNCHS